MLLTPTAAPLPPWWQVLREHTIKPGHDFLNSKRKAKIAELVEKYVAQGEQRRP